MMKSNLKTRIATHFCLIVLSVFALFPFAWMTVTSFKNRVDVFKSPPVWIPKTATLEHYQTISEVKFLRYFFNSTFIATTVMLIIVSVSLLAAYGLSRFTFKAKNVVLSSSLMGQLIPVSVMFIPFYIMFSRLRLIDTYWSLIIVYTITRLPFGIWMLTGYLNSIPKSLDEAAIIDGCSYFKIMLRIIIPVAIPGIITVAFYSFIICWQEFLFANIFINTVGKRTLPIGLVAFQGQYEINFGGMMAASVAATLPTTIVFVLFQKKLIPGLTGGALKG